MIEMVKLCECVVCEKFVKRKAVVCVCVWVHVTVGERENICYVGGENYYAV